MYPSYSETYLAESSINQIHLYRSKCKTKAPNAKGQMVTFGWRIKEDDSDTNIPIWQAQFGIWLNTNL